jgi:hypothetical protein
MDTLQQELGDNFALNGVNAIGYDSYNDTFTTSSDLPWLQDTVSEAAWEQWGAQWRDFWILDAEGLLYIKVDLNEYDLGRPGDYEVIKGLLTDAAEG